MNDQHEHSLDCTPDGDGPCDQAHDAYRRLATWTAPDSGYVLASGGFSADARRHYRTYVTAWLQWCQRGDAPVDPYTCDRALIAVWISDQYADAPLTTRAAIVSAVTSFYEHLLQLRVADGVDAHLTRATLAGAPVSGDPKRTGLRGDGPRWLMQAADRLTGRDALRDRAICYLLLNGHFGHEKIRPGTLLAMDLDDGRHHGTHTTWRIHPKNASATAAITITISRDAARALDAYTGRQTDGTHTPDPAQGRVTNPARGTFPDRGALFTAAGNRARGARLARSDSIQRIIRSVVASHEELDTLTADFIAATPPPAGTGGERKAAATA
ncbi:hypothetical protein ACF082_37755 [Streptomyces lydicus]|uniref:hypothetical protein n=1 Tax=Streptomyces lydicus TaxID=47763 RepID=UPI003701ADA9